MRSILLTLAVTAASSLGVGVFAPAAKAQYIGMAGYRGYSAPRAYNSYYQAYPGYSGSAYYRYGYPNGAYHGNYPRYQTLHRGYYYAPRYYPGRPVYGGGFYQPSVGSR